MRRSIWIFAGMVLQCVVFGQADIKMSRDDYISTFADLAMREMARVGIPASITLAQGCLESDNGNSSLAVRGNNHFGIKCHDWKGKTIHKNDDAWRECFRSYPSAYDSYWDHSQFLSTRSRYASLFQLNPDDYKGWAHGLKEAGYATSPDYARHLIRIIEENELFRYDQLVLEGWVDPGDKSVMAVRDGKPGSGDREPKVAGGPVKVAADGYSASRPVLVNNRIEYIVVRPGDTPESLRNELDLYKNEISRYNGLPYDADLEPGQIIYLQPKRRKAERGHDIHVVEEGETMEDISQIYGVMLKHLYRMNLMPEGAQPDPGMEIHLRKKKTESLLKQEPEPEQEREPEPEQAPEGTSLQFKFEDG